MSLSVEPTWMNLSLWLVNGPISGSSQICHGPEMIGGATLQYLYDIAPSENWRSAHMIGQIGVVIDFSPLVDRVYVDPTECA